jgi:hypothetical protein
MLGKYVQVSQLCVPSSGAFLNRGGFLNSVVTILASLRGKEDIDTYAVMDDFPIHEYPLVLSLLLGRGVLEWLPAY